MNSWQLLRYQTVDSTNAMLKSMEAAPHGTILCAEGQTAGRGRLGRSFVSQEGGLYLSLLLKRSEPLEELLHLTPMAAVAVRRAIMDLCPVEVEIKWINDLLVKGKKICGILTEIAPQGGIILGIGMNCNQKHFPEELRSIAASLWEFCGEVDREALLRALILRLKELDQCLFSHRKQWMEEYASHCCSIGKDVLLLSPTGRREAFAEGIGEMGELLVRLPDGSHESITMGEISLRGKTGYSPET